MLAANVAAQTYPVKPIRLIVPYPAGGPADVLARLIGQKLTEKWGQPVLVDNRGGANTIIGMDLAAKAAPDGYTLVIGTTAMATNPGLVATLPFDAIRDFAPVTTLVYIRGRRDGATKRNPPERVEEGYQGECDCSMTKSASAVSGVLPAFASSVDPNQHRVIPALS